MNPLYTFLGRHFRVSNLVAALPYRDLEEGIVHHHAGSLEVGFELWPGLEVLSTPEALEERWNAYRNLLRMAIPTRERGRITVEFGPESPQAIQNYRSAIQGQEPRLKKVLEARADMLEGLRLKGSLKRYRAYFSCTLGFTKSGSRPAYTPSEYHQVKTRANELRERIASTLASGGMAYRALDDQQAFEWIWRYLGAGVSACEPPRFVPRDERPSFPSRRALERGLDFPTLARQVSSSGIDNSNPGYLVIGDRFITTVVYSGLPASTYPGQLSRLLERLAPYSGYVVQDFVHDNYVRALAALHTKEGRIASMKDGKGLARDVTVNKKQERLEAVLGHLEDSGDHTYQFGMAVVLICRSREELESAKEAAVSASSLLSGVLPVAPGVQNPFVYMSLLPLSGRVSDFLTQGVESDLANLLPYTLPWRGDEVNDALEVRSGERVYTGTLVPAKKYTLTIPLRNRLGSLTFFDPYHPNLKNLNGLMAASTGGGKTYMAQVMAAHDLDRGAEVMILEHGENYKGFTKGFGGAYIPMQPDGESYNPFDLDPDQLEPDSDKLTFLSAWLMAALPPFADPMQEALKKEILAEGVSRTYMQAVKRRRGADGEPEVQWLGCQLSDLKEQIGVMKELGDGRRMSSSELSIAHTLVSHLNNWTGKSAYGQMFDQPTSVKLGSNLIYFSTLGLKDHADLRTAGTLYIQDQLWRRAKRERARPKRIIADEVWAALQHPVIREVVVGFFRRGRTYNTGTYAINNSILDLQGIPGLLESVSTLILGQTQGSEKVYRGIFEDLSDNALKMIGELKGRDGVYKEYLLWVRYAGGVRGERVRLDAVEEEYWLYTTKATEVGMGESHQKPKTRVLEEVLR